MTRTGETRREDTVNALLVALVAVKPSLRDVEIRLEASITADLQLDSLELIELATRIRIAYPLVDLQQWLARAMSVSGDTVASVAAVLDQASRPGSVGATGAAAVPS